MPLLQSKLPNMAFVAIESERRNEFFFQISVKLILL